MVMGVNLLGFVIVVEKQPESTVERITSIVNSNFIKPPWSKIIFIE